MTQKIFTIWLTGLVISIGICDSRVLGQGRYSAAAKPSENQSVGAPHLLPVDTMAYVRIADLMEAREMFGETSVGRMMNDPQIAPIMSDTYSVLRDGFEKIGQQIGLSLDDILDIPQGQIAIAAVPGNLSIEQIEQVETRAAEEDDESPEAIQRRLRRKRQIQNSISVVLIMDVGPRRPTLETVLEAVEAEISKNGFVRRTETVAGYELVRLMPPRAGRQEFQYSFHGDTFLFGWGYDTVGSSLRLWKDFDDGLDSTTETLATSNEFATLISRCIGEESTRPQSTFYVDPHEIIGRLVKRGGAAGLVWPLIEGLGLGKLRGIAGSSFYGDGEIEAVSHLHVGIDPPRDGFFGVVRPQEVDPTPPNFIPSDVGSYTTLGWRFDKTYENVEKILARFGNTTLLAEQFEPFIKQRLDIDVRRVLEEELAGRLIVSRWYEPPNRINSLTFGVAIELNDPSFAKELLDRMDQKFGEFFKRESINGQTVYLAPTGNGPNNNGNQAFKFRRPTPTMMVLGDWLVLTDSREFSTQMIRAWKDTEGRLINDPQFEFVTGELSDKLGGEEPFLVSLLDASQGFKTIYTMLEAGIASGRVGEGMEGDMKERVDELLTKHKLPPFETLEKYFAPTGFVGYDEPDGIHVAGFTLRAPEDD
ncbi:MAG: hypothetical protein AAF664_09840 [Planctomycetota bacterium]